MGSWETRKVLRSTHDFNFRGKKVKNPLHDLKLRDSSLTWNLSQAHGLDLGIPESIQSFPWFFWFSNSNGCKSPPPLTQPNKLQLVVIVKMLWRGKQPQASPTNHHVLLSTRLPVHLKAACPAISRAGFEKLCRFGIPPAFS